MSQEIKLTDMQQVKIKDIFLEMQKNAIRLGTQLIKAEHQLNSMFANNSVTTMSLDIVLGNIAGLRKDLRFEHLSTHLKMPAILSSQQIVLYNKLRGYTQ